MGERLNGGGLPGRRRVHPGDAGPGSGRVDDAAGVEALLAAAMRGNGVDTEAEQRAVAAFRAARDSGEHRARTRRRDDWRPREQRGGARSVKATLSVLVASLTLGGVAFAAIGTGGSSDHGAGDGRGRAEQTADTPGGSGGRPTATSSPVGSGRPDHPVTAQDTEAHCRAYEQVGGRGKALESTAWQRLIEAAGGEEKVAAYCAGQLAGKSAAPKPGKSGKTDGNGQGAGNGNGQDSGNGNGQGARSGGGQNAGDGGGGGQGAGNGGGEKAEQSKDQGTASKAQSKEQGR
ncbi:hypothetical protein ACGFNV_09750 [Streptomyces sp. NPDC048751]|uniref:hypothetical protein n=1 Tax=Streptomyces sp. NPDC048751 TaxID=3365591 RepID=UPI00371445FE